MKKLVIGLIAIFVIAFGFYVIINPGNIEITGNLIDNSIESNVKEFTVKAFRFDYNPDKVEVNQGDKVRIIIDNADVLHGIRIPDLGIKGNKIIEFVADKQGEFTWYCTNMCGAGHMQMQGKLIVK